MGCSQFYQVTKDAGGNGCFQTVSDMLKLQVEQVIGPQVELMSYYAAAESNIPELCLVLSIFILIKHLIFNSS